MIFCSQPAPKMKRLREGYEAALREFGTADAGQLTLKLPFINMSNRHD